MIFSSFVENLCFPWRWSRRMSISSSLGITSLTGTGWARGVFWSRCQDFSRNAKGQHFSTNISYSNHLVPGTIGSVWLILTRMEPGFGTTLESRLTSSCNNTTLNWFSWWYWTQLSSLFHLNIWRRWANGAWAEPDQQCVHLNYDAYRCQSSWSWYTQKIKWDNFTKRFVFASRNPVRKPQGVGTTELWRERWEFLMKKKTLSLCIYGQWTALAFVIGLMNLV